MKYHSYWIKIFFLKLDEVLDTLEKRKALRKLSWSCQRIMGCAVNKIKSPRVDLTKKKKKKITRKSLQGASSELFIFSNIDHYKSPEQLNNFCRFWIVKCNDIMVNNENTAQPEMKHGPKFNWQKLEQL